MVIDDGVSIIEALKMYISDPDLRHTHGNNEWQIVTDKFCVDTQRSIMTKYLSQWLGTVC